MKRYMKSMTI